MNIRTHRTNAPPNVWRGHLTWCISGCWSLWGWTAAGWGRSRAAPSPRGGRCRSGTAAPTPAAPWSARTGSRTLGSSTQLLFHTVSVHEHKERLQGLSRRTLLQLVVHDHEVGHGDHEEVEDEAHLAQLTDGRPAQLLHHRLVGALATDGRRVAQDDQPADQEHEGDLGGGGGSHRWASTPNDLKDSRGRSTWWITPMAQVEIVRETK